MDDEGARQHSRATDADRHRPHPDSVGGHPGPAGCYGGDRFRPHADLDHFKEVNDSLGHAAGDVFLRSIAARLAVRVRSEDLVVRIGGDEILILLAGVDDLDAEAVVAEKLREAITEPITIGGTTVRPSASIGVSILHDGEDPDQALRRADSALYQAKASGRDRIAVATSQ